MLAVFCILTSLRKMCSTSTLTLGWLQRDCLLSLEGNSDCKNSGYIRPQCQVMPIVV